MLFRPLLAATVAMCALLAPVRVEAAQRQRQRQIESGAKQKQKQKRAREKPAKTKTRDTRIIDQTGKVISPAVIANENRKKQILTENMDRELRAAGQSGDQLRWNRTLAYWRNQLRASGLDGK